MTSPADERVRQTGALIVGRLRAAQMAQLVSFVEWLRGVRIEDVTTGQIVPWEPWPHLIERAESWAAKQSEDVLKARQEGFSWLAAAYSVYVARRPQSNVLLISQGQREAYELLRKARFVAEHHATPVQLARANAGQIDIMSGGTILALPSTEDAGRGYTATLVVVDEAAYHPYAAQNYQAYYPTIADGGQLITLSTSNGPQGWFYNRYQASAHKVFVPWHARPDRDEEWHRRTLAELGEDAFMREFPATESEAFAASTGLVLPFDPQRHVRATHPAPWESCILHVAGLDPGGDDPTALVILGAYRVNGGPIMWHRYAELYRSGPVDLDEMCAMLYEWDVKTLVGDFGDASPYAEYFRRRGIDAHGAKKDRGAQYRKHAEVLQHNRLTIHQSCTSVNEFYSYWWDDKSSTPFATKTGEGHHADAIQAEEYAILWAEQAWERGILRPARRVVIDRSIGQTVRRTGQAVGGQSLGAIYSRTRSR